MKKHIIQKVFQQGITSCRYINNSPCLQNPILNRRPCKEIKIPVPWGHIAGKWWGPEDKRPILALHGWQVRNWIVILACIGLFILQKIVVHFLVDMFGRLVLVHFNMIILQNIYHVLFIASNN